MAKAQKEAQIIMSNITSTKLEGKLDLASGVFTVSQLNKNCRYGSKSFPGAQTLVDYAKENGSVKEYLLEGTDIQFGLDLAFPTIGTKITAGNKVINGVDPNYRESTGGGGGSSKSRLSAYIENDTLVIDDGAETKARITGEGIMLPVSVTDNFARQVAQVAREVSTHDFSRVSGMVGKPEVVVTLHDIVVKGGEATAITDEIKAGIIAKLAGEIQKAGKFNLFAELAKAEVKLVGGALDPIKAWAKKTFATVPESVK